MLGWYNFCWAYGSHLSTETELLVQYLDTLPYQVTKAHVYNKPPDKGQVSSFRLFTPPHLQCTRLVTLHFQSMHGVDDISRAAAKRLEEAGVSRFK